MLRRVLRRVQGLVKAGRSGLLLVVVIMVVLDCTAVECTLGDGGDRYQTLDMEMEYAMRMLELHVKNHETVQQQPAQQRVKPETVPRPKLSKGISEDKYVHFDRQWARYKRSQLS